MAEEPSRKQKQHDGYQSTVTRIILSVIEVLRADNISHVSEHAVKLRQQRASLEENWYFFRTLMLRFLAHVAEDKIEGEIKRSDLFEENVRLAIAHMDDAL